eukprot:42051_1
MAQTENWLAVPTVALSFLSITSCLCVCIISLKEGYVGCQCNRKKRYQNRGSIDKKNMISMEIIFYLSLCDGLWSIELFLNWFRQIDWLNISYWTDSQCIILGMYSQFLGCLSPLWHVLLAYHLCYLLFGGGLKSLEKQKYCHYLIIVLMAIIATLAPLYPHNHYGTYKNPHLPNNIKDYECWLKSVDYQLIWAIISILSLVIHYFTLIMAFYRWKQTSFFILSPVYYHICVKILRFVIVYTLLRLPATIDRLIEICSGKSYWGFIILNHYCQALIGFANFIVFMYNRKDKSVQHDKKHSKRKTFIDDSSNDDDDDDDTIPRELIDSSLLNSPLNIQKTSFVTHT